MNLLDLIERTPIPKPWAEGDKIPWDEPAFSRRMLRVHLSQDDDWASRRSFKIDAQVEWITQRLLTGPSKILDLGCGPGLYSSRLAALGHTCIGIDFSPASIEFARQEAAARHLTCVYHQADVRQAAFETDCDLVMFIFGELNVFRRSEAAAILKKAAAALRPGGRLLLEVSTFEGIRQQTQPPTSWYSASAGLFSDQPHFCLEERFWDDEQHVTTERYLIVDAQTGEVTPYASSAQAYTPEEYRLLLESCGFSEVVFEDQFGAEALSPESPLQVITAVLAPA